MKYLLDTCAWIFLQTAPEKLGQATLRLIEETNNELLLSVASVWELSIKIFSGNLTPPVPLDQFDDYLLKRLQTQNIATLGISVKHAVRASSLPFHHKDPFDRMIIAQSELEDAVIVTNDETFSRYGVTVIWG